MRLVVWIYSIFTNMSQTAPCQTLPTDACVTPPASGNGGKAPRKALAAKKTRVNKGPARPYRKQETTVLQDRIRTMERKIDLLTSKTIILKDRLEHHQKELVYRTEAAGSDDN